MAARTLTGLLVAALIAASPGSAAERRGPVIDMHVHMMSRSLPAPLPACVGKRPLNYPAVDPAQPVDPAQLVRCERPIESATNPVEHRQRTIAALRANDVRRAVVIGEPSAAAEWRRQMGEPLLAAFAGGSSDAAGLAELRRRVTAGEVAVFAEFGPQYDGRRADDPRYAAFWALAEELDVPVGIHLGEGNPGQYDEEADPYRARLTSPFQLEEVLQRHPRLRLWVMHAASPLTEEMLAMLFEYPQLHIDIAANVWNMPRAQFYDQLKRFVDAGFSRRILFGSDQTVFPQAIGLAIETIEEAPFLTAQQKRDILYHNAARFLRLSKQQVAADHAPQ